MTIGVSFSIEPATIRALQALMAEARALAAIINPSQPQLDRMEARLEALSEKGDKLMAAIDDLTTQVAQNTTVIGSAKTLILGFAAQLAAAGTDPVKLQALQTSLKSSDDELAAAVAANTPAAVAPAV